MGDPPLEECTSKRKIKRFHRALMFRIPLDIITVLVNEEFAK
jgi:hypothetical protein